MNIDYKATAYATGGRDGHVRVEDSPLDFEMALPAGLGGRKQEGANPEQLFAAGYAACFGSALQHVIRVRRLRLPPPDVQTTVGIGRNDAGNFQLEVAIVAIVDTDDAALAESLTQEAHQVCPYSHATRGNITVTLSSRTR
ncbi:Organic hydroperoxide resistance protein OhrB [bioreactor metagenome]|uniref:Organic hydroperoxide resistance protein OhrB n=1 Tax=bioreactor metagenome TaxID=1076179 RepID=A0A645EA37_9ZZZZ|nr:organic hydroperoxide resistance protein [Christensenella sp.]